MNNHSKLSWYGGNKGSSSSWDTWNEPRHDARHGSKSQRDRGFSLSHCIEKKKDDAKTQSKRMQKVSLLENESRCKWVDPDYDQAYKVCLFFPAGKCAHCRGDHPGLPPQSRPIKDLGDDTILLFKQAKVLTLPPLDTNKRVENV